ncbi:hypothetical protein G9A89_002657 [Geosiphon pyriformis]|nr:hypothetical protein G9A89_002657 [Geosiphon pyriformis]
MLKLHHDLHPEKKTRSPYWKSLAELEKWQPGTDQENIAKVSLRPRPEFRTAKTREEKNKQETKLIVCHDMAGGYQEDYFKIGYSIQYWQYVDTFIYFSHKRVTVPPPQWTNAAHRNGVKIFGTYLTEWEGAISENELWVRGPSSEENSQDTANNDRSIVSTFFADKLIQMAEYYKFDGWFINIEAPLIGGTPHANQVIQFLNYLKIEMHRRIPGSEVLWYDSVTVDGAVAWQDQLNDLNFPFFRVSDGIFTNYTWRQEYPAQSAITAGKKRRRDVFTGIDIWGRKTYGGGGYTTYKALEVISKAKTSVALFAPAWTFEHLGQENFWTNDRLFWLGGFSSQLPSKERENLGDVGTTVKNPGIVDYIQARYPPDNQSFYTNFSRGCGNKFFIDGKLVLENQDWYHLSHQSIQPNMVAKELSPLTFDYSFEKSFQGGTSLLVSSNNPSRPIVASLSLYDLDIELSTTRPTRIAITYLPAFDGISIGTFIKIGSSSRIQAKCAVDFLGGNDNRVSSDGSDGKTIVVLLSESISKNNMNPIASVKTYKPINYTRAGGWITSEFILEPVFFVPSLKDAKIQLSIQEFGLTLFKKSSDSDPLTRTTLGYIGELSIVPLIDEHTPFKEVVQNVRFEMQHVDHKKDQGLLRIWGNVVFELGIRVSDNSTSDTTVQSTTRSNTFAHYYIYVGLSKDTVARPVLDELTFLGIADTNKFWIGGYDVRYDKIKNEGVGLVIWVQSVEEKSGVKTEAFEWRRCWVKLSRYVL